VLYAEWITGYPIEYVTVIWAFMSNYDDISTVDAEIGLLSTFSVVFFVFGFTCLILYLAAAIHTYIY